MYWGAFLTENTIKIILFSSIYIGVCTVHPAPFSCSFSKFNFAVKLLQIRCSATQLADVHTDPDVDGGTAVCWVSLSGDKSDRLICPVRGWRVIGHI